jgi:hypothetical protein
MKNQLFKRKKLLRDVEASKAKKIKKLKNKFYK